jgi:RNA polymerase sigma-70 factor (ECF subfamily)
MLMLEMLGPVERAVFLLREAIDYDYAAISQIVDRSEAACRQMVSRAKAQLARQPSPQSRPSPSAERLMQRFLAAAQTGELPELLALLSDDAVLYSDGGGKVLAAGRPVRSAERIARFLVGVRRHAPKGESRVQFVSVNGAPGALLYVGGRLERVIAVEVSDGRIGSIFIVRNPDKLRHLPKHAEN